MKSFLFLSFLLLSCMATAQVGVGTTSPGATLDVTAAYPTGTTTGVDGILIPRVTRQRAKSMTSVTTSTIIYVDTLNDTATLTAINITAIGFYYYSGGAWQALSGSASNAWNLTGNTNATASSFIGTGAATNFDVVFKRQNLAAGRIGPNNTGFGLGALAVSTLGAGANNTAFGHNALTANTGGSNNVAVGQYALTAIVTGSGNVAVGQNALATYTGSNNVAVGLNALRYCLGVNNTAIGYNALQGLNNAAAQGNTAIGNEAMGLTSGDISYCTAVGYQALNSVTDIAGARGLWNTGVGYQAGNNITTGKRNTVMGYQAGNTISTGEYNIAIGYNAQVASATGSGQIQIGDSNTTSASTYIAWSLTSDKRWKDNIKDSGLGLDFIKNLRPVSYIRKNDVKGKTEYGFIAQEIEASLIKAGDPNNGIISKDDNGMYSVRYNDFIPITVKAVQEQQAQIDELKKQNEELMKVNAAILKRLEALEKRQ